MLLSMPSHGDFVMSSKSLATSDPTTTHNNKNKGLYLFPIIDFCLELRSRSCVQDSFPITSEIVGYILLGAFFCEFIARAKAQGGERFFRPMYNKLEFFVLIAGV